MASSGFRAPTFLCSVSPSSTAIKASMFHSLYSSSVTVHSKTSRLDLHPLFPPKGLGHFSPWSGLKHLGLSVTWRSSKFDKRKCKDRVAYASLFGVGAPEALVIGVVALLVFGPKGLAEVARSLGKTLRAFQPTIRELQEVSREFKSTLEKEIGLDEISTTTPRTEYKTSVTSTASSVSSAQESKIGTDPNGISSPSAYSNEEYLKVTEQQLKAAASQQKEQTSPELESVLEAQANPQDVESSKGSASGTSENSNSIEQSPNVASSEGQVPRGQASSPEGTIEETAG